MMLFAPVLMLALVEGGLRLVGYGHPSSFLVPIPGTDAYTTNEKFLLRYYAETEAARANPFLLPASKATNAFRVFILGESAALGTPNPSFGFGRILEVILRGQYPGKRIELYNAAVRGINSHIVLPIARECAGHQPDVAIVYMGNNEVVGLHGPGPDSTVADRNLPLIRLTHFLKGTKLGELSMSTLRRRTPPTQDMAFFRAHRIARDDPRREPVYAHFQANLTEILRVLTGAGAKVLVAAVPVNLRDFPPLASLPRADLSEGKRAEWQAAYAQAALAGKSGQATTVLEHLDRALTIDSHPAELHFRLAQTYAALNRFDSAKAGFEAARDWDALQLRTDSRLNGIVRQTAAAAGGDVLLVDAEKSFQTSELSDHGVPGQKLFTDHVHLRFAGDYLLARTFFSNIVTTCGGQLGPASGLPVPSIQACAEQLAYNEWEDIEVRAAILHQLSGPPFLDRPDHSELIAMAEADVKARTGRFTSNALERVKLSYQRVLAQRPDDWQTHLNYGAFLALNRDFTNAVAHLEVPVRFFPTHVPFRIRLADALAWAGHRDLALEQLREALRLEPRSITVREGLAALGPH